MKQEIVDECRSRGIFQSCEHVLLSYSLSHFSIYFATIVCNVSIIVVGVRLVVGRATFIDIFVDINEILSDISMTGLFQFFFSVLLTDTNIRETEKEMRK